MTGQPRRGSHPVAFDPSGRSLREDWPFAVLASTQLALGEPSCRGLPSGKDPSGLKSRAREQLITRKLFLNEDSMSYRFSVTRQLPSGLVLHGALGSYYVLTSPVNS